MEQNRDRRLGLKNREKQGTMEKKPMWLKILEALRIAWGYKDRRTGTASGRGLPYLNIARQKDQRMRGLCKLKPFRVLM